MSAADDSTSRLDSLEMRIAFQDQTIEELNAVVTEQWRRVEELSRQIQRLTDRLQAVEERPAGDPADEPPPPHY